MVSRLSIMGMYLYDNTVFDDFMPPSVKPDIFGVAQNLVNNVLSFDKDLFLSRLLMECESLSCIYPAPSILKKMVKIWSETYNYNWCKMMTTAALKYVPIWNVDANVENMETEESSDEETQTHSKSVTNGGTDTTTYGKTRNETETNAGNDVTTYDTTDKTTHQTTDTTTHNTTDTRTDALQQTFEPGNENIEFYNQNAADRTETVTTSVSAYNDSTLQTKEQVSTVHPTKVTRNTSVGTGDKTTNTGTQTNAKTGTEALAKTGTETLEKDGTETFAHGHTITDAETFGGTDRFTHGHTITETNSIENTNDSTKSKTNEERKTGNIGVTTTQSMIEQEWKIDVFNIYDVLVESFKEHFCIMVY